MRGLIEYIKSEDAVGLTILAGLVIAPILFLLTQLSQ